MPFSRSPLRPLCFLLPALLLAGCDFMSQQQQPAADAPPPADTRYLQLVHRGAAGAAGRDQAYHRKSTHASLALRLLELWHRRLFVVPGEIIDRPSPTAVWAPDHWVKHEFGWAFVAAPGNRRRQCRAAARVKSAGATRSRRRLNSSRPKLSSRKRRQSLSPQAETS